VSASVVKIIRRAIVVRGRLGSYNAKLIVFYKVPAKGSVKTRLAQSVGDDGACKLYRAMILDLLENLRDIHNHVLLFEAKAEEAYAAPMMETEKFETLPQRGSDLGERMFNALSTAFDGGAELALLIGTDIPQINAGLVKRYLKMLSNRDIVLGPSSDGGYYLIGFKRGSIMKSLFEDVEWSSASVFDVTLKRARNAGLRVGTGPALRDIDLWEDLQWLFKQQKMKKRMPRVYDAFMHCDAGLLPNGCGSGENEQNN
jgi:rSAM/selenodomain-associated transferase 1